MLFIGSGRKELLEQEYPDLCFVFHKIPSPVPSHLNDQVESELVYQLQNNS